jgi:hypothetical protein
MKIKKEFYKQVYFIDSPDSLKNKSWNYFLMTGKKNWDHYFLPFKTKIEYDIIENVEILEFSSQEDLFCILKKINKKSLINYCLDDKFYILKYA